MRINKNTILLDKNISYTPISIASLYPSASRIFVLDFKLEHSPEVIGESIYEESNVNELLGVKVNKEEGKTFIGKKFTLPSKQLVYNIDHHYDNQYIGVNLSTTHQAIIFNQLKQMYAKESDVILINHPDTDSILACAAISNPTLSEKVIHTFSKSALAADHTGEPDLLADIINGYYYLNDPIKSLKLVKNFLDSDSDLSKLGEEANQRYQTVIARRQLAEKLVKNESFLHAGNGVYWIKLDTYIETTMFANVFRKLKLDAKVIIVGVPSEKHKGKWKISMRAVNDFDLVISMKQIAADLGLSRYGYGGRAKGGSTGRNLASSEPISPQDFAVLVSSHDVIKNA